MANTGDNKEHDTKVAMRKAITVWLATWVGMTISEFGSLLAALFTILLIIDHIWRRYVKKLYHGTFMKSDLGGVE